MNDVNILYTITVAMFLCLRVQNLWHYLQKQTTCSKIYHHSCSFDTTPEMWLVNSVFCWPVLIGQSVSLVSTSGCVNTVHRYPGSVPGKPSHSSHEPVLCVCYVSNVTVVSDKWDKSLGNVHQAHMWEDGITCAEVTQISSNVFTRLDGVGLAFMLTGESLWLMRGCQAGGSVYQD